MKQATNSKAKIKISRIESFAGINLQWAEEQKEFDIITFYGLDVCDWRYQKVCARSD